MADQELMTIIQNIEALVEQAKQSMGAGDMSAPEEGGEDVTPDMLEKIMKAMGEKEGSPEDEKENEEKVVVKGKTVKSDDKDEDDKDVAKSDLGITNDDKAEERMDGANPTEAEINAVAKAFLKAYRSKKAVQKSDDKAEIYKVLKALALEVQEIKKVSEDFVAGTELGRKIINSVEKSRPKNNLEEIQKSLDIIKGMAENKKEVVTNDGTGNGSHYVSKSLAEGDGSLLKGIFFRNAR
jgi:hypothetical protein